MQYTEIMVRYGELSTKGKNRQNFIDRLATNVTQTLHDLADVKVKGHRDRMHIQLNGANSSEVIKRLQNVFGIQNFSPAIKVERDVTKVCQVALELMQELYHEGLTFKINTRRSDHNFAYDTNQMNDYLGSYLLEKIPGLKVQMKNPDVTLRCEIRLNGIYLSYETISGEGGLPVGTAGKAVLMLSGGIDSPVAGYLALKRGVDIEMVHFYSPPYTSQKALDKAKELTAKLTLFGGNIRFIEVPFTKIQEEVKQKVPSGYLMTIQRRFMFRLAEAVARKRHALAIFNGEALGQVASQTLESMAAINDVTNMPILRPVVSLDKNEIIKISQKIDTFDLSIMPFEDCCTIFAPPAPKTKPRIDKCREYETRLDIESLVNEALANIKIIEIKPGEQYLNKQAQNFIDLL